VPLEAELFVQRWFEGDREADREVGLWRWRAAAVWALLIAMWPAVGTAQSYLAEFHTRNAEMKDVQPTWVTPLVGTTPLLGQFVREEFVRQKVAGGGSVWNVGNNKGLSLILSRRVETDLSMPNYVVHGSAAGTDGLGDFCFTTRVRLA
jgi:hypothetical protein